VKTSPYSFTAKSEIPSSASGSGRVPGLGGGFSKKLQGKFSNFRQKFQQKLQQVSHKYGSQLQIFLTKYSPQTAALTKYIAKNAKLTPQAVLSGAVVVLVMVGMGSAMLLTQVSQDVRQQAMGDSYAEQENFCTGNDGLWRNNKCEYNVKPGTTDTCIDGFERIDGVCVNLQGGVPPELPDGSVCEQDECRVEYWEAS
jgi:hypothetical protein